MQPPTPSPGSAPLPAGRPASRVCPEGIAGGLVERILLLAKSIEDAIEEVGNARAAFAETYARAGLLSVQQTAAMLHSSKPQVYRWSKSGELQVTWLNAHPRYRIDDIQTFVAARALRGKPLKRKADVVTKPAKRSRGRPKRKTKK